MSRILAYTSPARGHLFPLTPVLDELHRRGHEVVLRTLSSEVEMIRSRGIDASPIAPAIEAIEHDDWRARNPYGAVKRSVRTLCSRAELDAADLQEAIAAERPDALLVDIASWGALAAAEAWAGPWASFCPFPLPLSSRDTPPYGPGLPPAGGPAGRLRDRLARPLLDDTLGRAIGNRLDGVRASLGLDPFERAEEMLLAPPLLLYMTAEPFEYPRSDWPANVVMIGPCAWDPPAELPAQLDGIEAPLVLVTTSSEFQNDGRLVAAALEAFAEEPVHVVATLPSASAKRLRAPANASILEFAPHAPILPLCACVITHGGMGGTQKALASGVPVCAVPFGRDQLEVARRVAVAGAGNQLPAWRLRPGRLLAKAREATSRREDAERVARGFAAAGGASAGADAFERRLLGAPRH